MTKHVLVCVECAAEASPDARGWQAYLTVGDEDAEDVEGACWSNGCSG